MKMTAVLLRLIQRPVALYPLFGSNFHTIVSIHVMARTAGGTFNNYPTAKEFLIS